MSFSAESDNSGDSFFGVHVYSESTQLLATVNKQY